MNNIIIQSIRVAVVLAIALFALVSDVFAAPILTPVTVTRITDNSATIVGHVSNPQKNSTVWFEINNNYGAPTAVAVQGIWNEGTFEWNLRDLNPGQTYSYRSVAMEGGVTVYSNPSSFTTKSPKIISSTVAYQSNSQTVTQVSKTTEQKTTQTTKATTQVKTVKEDAPITTEEAVNKDGFTNRNSATVIGAGNSLFPSTLIGWLLLILAILVVTLIGRMIYESTEKKRKTLDEKDKENNDEIE